MYKRDLSFCLFDFKDILNSIKEDEFSIIGEGGFLKLINYNYYEDMISTLDSLIPILTEKVFQIYEHERKNGFLNEKVYNLNTEEDDFVIVSDLHGDREAFLSILEKEGFFRSVKKYIFLGDYIDRGPYQPSVLLGILLIKFFFPDRVFLLRGNHEYFRETENGELKQDVSGGKEVFINFWPDYFSEETIRSIHNFFKEMPAIVVLNNEILLVHGGIPRQENKEGDYPSIGNFGDLSDSDLIYQMAWSDPEDKNDVYMSGATRFSFAYKQFRNFMDRLNMEMMIRGHEMKIDGYDIPQRYNNRLITIFSTGCNRLSTEFNKSTCCNCYSGYSRVKPHYIIIKNYELLQIKSVFSDEISKEFKITELKEKWQKEREEGEKEEEPVYSEKTVENELEEIKKVDAKGEEKKELTEEKDEQSGKEEKIKVNEEEKKWKK